MEEKEERVNYKRREDGVVLTDQEDIALYMYYQQEEIMSNLLLGTYSSKGQYSINQTLLKELSSCNKVIKENFDNSYLLIARSNRGIKYNLKFVLTIQKNESENKKTAVLKVVEDVVKPDGETKERLTTVVARYVDDDDIYFFRKVKKVFNLYTLDESEGKDILDESLIPEILKRQTYLSDLHSKAFDRANVLAKLYIERLLKAMVNSGEFGKYVLSEYEKLFKQLGEGVLKPGAYKNLLYKLYGILTEAQKKYEMDEEDKKRLILIINEFLAASQNILLNSTEMAPVKKKEEAKAKKAEAKKSASKPTAKKKAAVKKAAPAKKKGMEAAGIEAYVPYATVHSIFEETREDDDKIYTGVSKNKKQTTDAIKAIGSQFQEALDGFDQDSIKCVTEKKLYQATKIGETYEEIVADIDMTIKQNYIDDCTLEQ